MTNSSGARGFLSGRRGPLIGAVLVTALLVFVALGVWQYLDGVAWRTSVPIDDVYLVAPQKLRLSFACVSPNPEVEVEVWETTVDVQLKVVAVDAPEDCLDGAEVYLQEPLGDRIVVDKHTGSVVLRPQR